jgi:hypothetical protein
VEYAATLYDACAGSFKSSCLSRLLPLRAALVWSFYPLMVPLAGVITRAINIDLEWK